MLKYRFKSSEEKNFNTDFSDNFYTVSLFCILAVHVLTSCHGWIHHFLFFYYSLLTKKNINICEYYFRYNCLIKNTLLPCKLTVSFYCHSHLHQEIQVLLINLHSCYLSFPSLGKCYLHITCHGPGYVQLVLC